MKILKLAPKNLNGFTIVEVALSLGIVASAVLALLALIPLANEAASDAVHSTITGIILEDVHKQLEGLPLQATASGDYFSYFYDGQGIFLDSGDSTTPPIDFTTLTPPKDPRYRAEVKLLTPAAVPGGVNSGNLLAAQISLFWPVLPDTGEAMPVGVPAKKTVTYYITTMVTDAWSTIGNGGGNTFTPKIEF